MAQFTKLILLLLLSLSLFAQVQTIDDEAMPGARTKVNSNFSWLNLNKLTYSNTGPTWVSGATLATDMRAGARTDVGGVIPAAAYKPDQLGYGAMFGITVPSTSTWPGGGTGAAGYAIGGSATTGLIGLLGVARPGANDVYSFGGNFIVSNCNQEAPYAPAGTCFTGVRVVSVEADTNNHSTTSPWDYNFVAGTAGTQRGINSAYFAAFPLAGTAVPKKYALQFPNGSQDNILFGGAKSTANNSASGAIHLQSISSTGTSLTGAFDFSPTGAWRLFNVTGVATEIRNLDGTLGPVITGKVNNLAISGGTNSTLVVGASATVTVNASTTIPTLANGLTRVNVSGGVQTFGNALPGTDYAPPTTGTGPLSGNGSGGFAATVFGGIVSLWAGGSCTGYLHSSGTCAAVGTTSGTLAAGNDSRFTDARTPTAHATTHVTGGSDVIANAVAGGASGLLSGADKSKLNSFISVDSYNPVGDGVADDTTAIQNAINAALLPTTGGKLLFTPGKTYKVTTLNLPNNTVGHVNLYLEGYGATLTSTTGAPVIRRAYASSTSRLDSTLVAGTDARVIVRGLTIRGNQTTGQKGIYVENTYQSVFEDLTLDSLDTGIDCVYCMHAATRTAQIRLPKTAGLVYRDAVGVWTDGTNPGTATNSPSNSATVDHLRVYCDTGAIDANMIGVSAGRIDNSIFEGSNCSSDIRIDMTGNGLTFGIKNLHVENAPTTAVISLVGGSPAIDIDGILGAMTGTPVWIDSTGLGASATIQLKNLQGLTSGVAAFTSGAANGMWMFRDGVGQYGQYNALDTTNWTGGTRPWALNQIRNLNGDGVLDLSGRNGVSINGVIQ